MKQPLPNIVGMGALGRAIRSLIPENLQVVVFCVKAYDLEKALEEQQELWQKDTPFVALCNGDTSQILRNFQTKFLSRPVRSGMTTIGATVDSLGVLKVFSGQSVTRWGNLPGCTSNHSVTPDEVSLIQLNEGWSWENDMTPFIRKKWMMNATINTLCAALRLPKNGSLRNHRRLVDEVFDEAFELSFEIFPLSTNEKSLPGKDVARAELWSVVSATAENENSMMRDVRLRRKTESSFLAGRAMGKPKYRQLEGFHIKILHLTE